MSRKYTTYVEVNFTAIPEFHNFKYGTSPSRRVQAQVLQLLQVQYSTVAVPVPVQCRHSFKME